MAPGSQDRALSRDVLYGALLALLLLATLLFATGEDTRFIYIDF